jgi:monomeric sarcosine oxidase
VTKVIVLGLGGMGSAAAAHLARRGADVVGVEQFTPAHDRGSSHGDTRIIRQAYFEDPAYVPLLLHVYDLWADLERDDPGIFRLTGGLMVGRPDAEVVAGSLASVREHGLSHELLDAGEIRTRFPNFAPADDEIGLYEKRSGLVRPERTVQEHVRRALVAGADLRFEERAVGWEADDSGVRVTTTRGTIEGDRLVVAPGAWAPQQLAELGVPMTVTRELVFWFEPSSDPASYAPGRQPIFIWERPGASLYGFPCLDGAGRGAKIGLHRHGIPTDPDALDREVATDEVDEVTAVVRELVPTLPGTFLRGVACLYTTTPDQNFVIGPHPEHPNAIVACGFSGHGFKFVPVVGEVLADLALEGATGHPIGLFDPTRFR